MTTNNTLGYQLETTIKTPIHANVYTLNNGLKVYLSAQAKEPRVQTMIAVRAGSKNDPTDTTGLAHYLEHMMFKGTSKIASLDWEKEAPLLQQISNLYEQYRTATPKERKEIYKKIDALSTEAAQYVAANEYDKMAASIGAEGTNAFTSLDRTVYLNDIPNNEIERWLQLEAERFRELVLRLFHTELETVYEEYNRAQTSDSRRMWEAMMKVLLPTHPYGMQTILGKAEHLKSPSMENIHDFFSTYYVPNNMAVIMVGDFNPDEVIKKVAQYWGKLKPRTLPQWDAPLVPIATSSQTITITGKEKARVQLNWKLQGAGSDEELMAELAAGVLFNTRAGLMDVNLLQKQKIGQKSAAGVWAANDYSFFMVYAEPREEQTLEVVVQLLQEQLDLLRAGDFEAWLLEAIINEKEIQELKKLETNNGRSFYLLDAFVFNANWEQYQARFQRMRSITKQDLINFANQVLSKAQAVILLKEEGNPPQQESVDKPPITPIKLNNQASSAFMKCFEQQQNIDILPDFLNYDEHITTCKLTEAVDLNYIHNKDNQLFELTYILEMGKNSNRVLPYVLRYLKFLGTKKRTAKEWQQEIFKEGLTFEISVQQEVTYLTLSGLERSFARGVELVEELLQEPVDDERVLQRMVADVKKERADRKKDKQQILQGAMLSYAYYGEHSPMRFELPEALLEQLTPKKLSETAQSLMTYEHSIFYYGSQPIETVKHVLTEKHQMVFPAKTLLPARTYQQLETTSNKVVFVHYEGMPQVEILLVSKGKQGFDAQQNRIARLYNEYFGYGLSSIVFQEIREARALAYSTYVYNSSPKEKDKAHYLRAFVGTQTDKLQEATEALLKLMDTFPISEAQVEHALQGIIKKIETERTTGAAIFWEKRDKAKLGLKKDPKIEDYAFYKKLAQTPHAAVNALQQFHKEVIKNRAFTFLVLGDKKRIDMDYLKNYGIVNEMTLDVLFGY